MIAQIVAARVRETIGVASLDLPPVLVVDHGGPSPASAALRDRLTGDVRALLGSAVLSVTAASMEGGAHAHNHPLLAEALGALSAPRTSPPPARTDVVVALLFLSPGRHAGPGGDIAQICGAAEASSPSLCCHLTDLVGTHPLATPALAAALQNTLSNLHDPNLA